MDDHKRYLLLFLSLIFSCFTYSSYAYQFVVGGRDGWVVNPSENYNRWAERMRFQVNDTLLFKYNKGSDSVLAVTKDDYDKCNTGNPVIKLDDGNSVFKFGHSGPFYFISGNKVNCDQGQKLMVVVLAVRNRPTPPPGSPSPAAAPPTWSSPSPSQTAGGSPAPASSPLSPSPSSYGGAPAPASSPSSPSPWSGTPAPANSPWSPTPAGEAPAPETYGSGPSPAATSGPTSPSSTTAGSPNSSTPASGTPADVNAPGGSPRRNLAAPSCSPSVVLVSLVLSVGLGGFIVSP